jgi:hypothetical protein
VRHLLDALILSAVAVLPRTPVFTVAARFAGDTAPSGRSEGRTGIGGSITVAKTLPG